MCAIRNSVADTSKTRRSRTFDTMPTSVVLGQTVRALVGVPKMGALGPRRFGLGARFLSRQIFTYSLIYVLSYLLTYLQRHPQDYGTQKREII